MYCCTRIDDSDAVENPHARPAKRSAATSMVQELTSASQKEKSVKISGQPARLIVEALSGRGYRVSKQPGFMNAKSQNAFMLKQVLKLKGGCSVMHHGACSKQYRRSHEPLCRSCKGRYGGGQNSSRSWRSIETVVKR